MGDEMTPARRAEIERLIATLLNGPAPRRVEVERRAADALEEWLREDDARQTVLPLDTEAEARADAWCREHEPVRTARPLTRPRCPICSRPVAAAEDWRDTPQGEGEHLCWGEGGSACRDVADSGQTPYQRGNRDGLLSLAAEFGRLAEVALVDADRLQVAARRPSLRLEATRSAERQWQDALRRRALWQAAARMARTAAEALPGDPEVTP